MVYYISVVNTFVTGLRIQIKIIRILIRVRLLRLKNLKSTIIK